MIIIKYAVAISFRVVSSAVNFFANCHGVISRASSISISAIINSTSIISGFGHWRCSFCLRFGSSRGHCFRCSDLGGGLACGGISLGSWGLLDSRCKHNSPLGHIAQVFCVGGSGHHHQGHRNKCCGDHAQEEAAAVCGLSLPHPQFACRLHFCIPTSVATGWLPPTVRAIRRVPDRVLAQGSVAWGHIWSGHNSTQVRHIDR